MPPINVDIFIVDRGHRIGLRMETERGRAFARANNAEDCSGTFWLDHTKAPGLVEAAIAEGLSVSVDYS